MHSHGSRFQFEPIGYLETCFKEKFGIPRQPGLVGEAQGILQLRPDPHLKTAIRGLETFSHVWLVFVFHLHGGKNWKPSIRPPRLGGAKKIGVLASRSPHRPNPVGISAVRLEKIDLDYTLGPRIYLRGVDLLDGTPILDIKPYLPYADSIPEAKSGWASEEIDRVTVEFSERAEQEILNQKAQPSVHLRTLIQEILSLDPRPAFQKKRLPVSGVLTQGTRYGFKLMGFDVQWEVRDGKFRVLCLL